MVKTDKGGSNGCSADDATSKTIILCQDDILEINCDDPTTIKINKANYGRTVSGPCVEYLGIDILNCNNQETTIPILQGRCEGRKSCVVPVTMEVFGNPCLTITEYLEVSYHCENRCNGQTTSRTEELLTTPGKRTAVDGSTTAIVDTDHSANQTMYNTTMNRNVNNNNMQSELDLSPSKVLTVGGGVLGGILAVVLILIVYIILKCYIFTKQQPASNNSALYEMSIGSDVQHNYSGLIAQPMIQELSFSNDQSQNLVPVESTYIEIKSSDPVYDMCDDRYDQTTPANYENTNNTGQS